MAKTGTDAVGSSFDHLAWRWVLLAAPPALAFVTQMAVGSYAEPTVAAPSIWFLFFYPAVFVSAWLGGQRAALAVAAITAAAVLWGFLPSERTFDKPVAQYITAAAFFATGALFAVLLDRLRGAGRELTAALRLSENDNARLRRIADGLLARDADLVRAQSPAKIGTWRVDLRHDELGWSAESCRIYGVPPGPAMTYEGFLARVHPDDRARVDDAWRAALEGQPYEVEHRLVTDGTAVTKWVREQVLLTQDAHGEPVSGVGITCELTHREEGEAALRAERDRLERALQGADIVPWEWDVVSDRVTLDARWAEVRGLQPQEVPRRGEERLATIHPDDVCFVRARIADCRDGRRSDYHAEYRVRTRPEGWIWILDRGRVVGRDERGRPTRMAGAELDITARKLEEHRLRVAEATASRIVAMSADAIVSIDQAQRITSFNEAAQRIFGDSREEAIGAPLDILVPERFRESHRRHLEAVARGADTARRMGARASEIAALRKNGEEFLADAAISKITVGSTIVMTVCLRDVTAQRRAEREQALLAEVGAAFAATLDYDATLANITRLVARDVADFCIIDVVEDGQSAG